MIYIKKFLVMSFGLFFFMLHLHAAKIQISPISLSLSPQESIQVINLTNVGDTSVLYQLMTINAWRQLNGKAHYQKTTELAAMPPIMKIAPGHKQVIRLGYIGTWNFKEEKAYRILLHQVLDPPKKDTNGKTIVALNVGLDLSIPIFVKPNLPTHPMVTGTAHLKHNDLTVTLHNTGSEHIKVRDLQLVTAHGNKLWSGTWLMYALASSSETLTQHIDLIAKSKPRIVELLLDDNTHLQLPL